jgi:hypothetical protein
MSDNHKLTQEEFNELFDDNVSVKRNKELSKKAAERFCYVIHTLEQIVGRKWHWFDFNNEDGEDHRGFFDSNLYENEIAFTGEMATTDNRDFTLYDEEFPTTWLKDDFEAKVQAEVNEFAHAKNIEEQAKKAQKQAEQNLMKTIKDGLPDLKRSVYEKTDPQFRSLFTFKSAEEILADQKKSLKVNEDMAKFAREIENHKAYLQSQLSAEEFSALKFKSIEQLWQEEQVRLAKDSQKKHKP